jgi:hypothetical protein
MMNRGVEGWIRLLVAMGVLLLPDLVQANVGPPSSGGQVVAEPVGIQEVEIRWEVLQIDLRPLADNELAIVVAEYQLENYGPEKTLNLLFASGSAEVSQLKVSLNETPIPSHPAPETPLPESWQPPKETPGLHGEPPVSYLGYGSQPAVPYAMTVVIPEGSQKLRVQYRAEAAIHKFGQPTLYHQFAYILAPARAWSGFGGMDVKIQLPQDWIVSCNLPLQRTGDALAGRFSELPAEAIALTTQAAVSESYVVANEGLFWLYLLSAVFGLAFCWKRGRLTGRELAKRPSESPPRRVWTTSLFAGILAGLATFAFGLLAIFVPDFLLPANQITHYGYGKFFYLFGVVYLSSNVVLIGFGVAQLTARWFKKRIAV